MNRERETIKHRNHAGLDGETGAPLVAASTTSIHNQHEQSTIKWRIFATLPQLIR